MVEVSSSLFPSRLWRTTTSLGGSYRIPTYEVYVTELLVLGLAGREFSSDDYLESLIRQLGLLINTRRLEDLQDPLARLAIEEADAEATISYNRERNEVNIWLADSLKGWLREYTMFHELAHIAAGHPFFTRLVKEGRGVYEYKRGSYPPKRLARKSPFKDKQLCDREAEVRARYSIFASELGAEALRTKHLTQAF